MRLGTTSYIYPADIATNVGKLADKVRDVELVIFEADDQYNNLPDEETIARLRSFAESHDLTYTVHLPLDLRLAEEQPALDKAVRVIRSTERLDPRGFVVHLDGYAVPGTQEFTRWRDNSLRSLELLSGELNHVGEICVENLENQTPEMIGAILDALPVSCCADVGHFWKRGEDPLPPLESWFERIRVVHIHGFGTRDHKSLSLMPPQSLDPVMEFLAERFTGIVTVEVFSEKDFHGSMEAVKQSLHRLGRADLT